MASKPNINELWNEFVIALRKHFIESANPPTQMVIKKSAPPYAHDIFYAKGKKFHLKDDLARQCWRVEKAIYEDKKIHIQSIASFRHFRKTINDVIALIIEDSEKGLKPKPSNEYLAKVRRELKAEVKEWQLSFSAYDVRLDQEFELDLSNILLLSKDSPRFKTLSETCENGFTDIYVNWPHFIKESFSAKPDPITYVVVSVRAADLIHAQLKAAKIAHEFLYSLKPFLLDAYLTARRSQGVDLRSSGSIYPNDKFILNNSTINLLDDFSWQAFLSIWRNESATKWEKTLRRAAYWTGVGISDLDESSAFVKFTTVLEMLLLNNDENITSNLAERLAFILAEDKTERIRIWKKAKKLYGIRCDIVHDGDYEAVSDDLSQIRNLAMRCLFKILQSKEITSFEELVTWCNNKKFESEIT